MGSLPYHKTSRVGKKPLGAPSQLHLLVRLDYYPKPSPAMTTVHKVDTRFWNWHLCLKVMLAHMAAA